MGWEHFQHGADIGVRGKAKTKNAAFAEAALALTAVITDPGLVKQQEKIHITCQAPDLEILFIDWLNAIIFAMAERRMLFSRFDVILSDHALEADVWGEAIDIARHHPAVEVKGATYTGLKVIKDAEEYWTAQCVVDV